MEVKYVTELLAINWKERGIFRDLWSPFDLGDTLS